VAPGTATANAAERASQAVGSGVAKDNVLQAAEGVFGRGAEGLAQLIEDILRKQGDPAPTSPGAKPEARSRLGCATAPGRSTTRWKGDRPVFWNGPSLGFDFGADAAKVFVLVYNLHDSQEIFKRYPGAEGNAYVVGGFTASYMRRGDVVLIRCGWASAPGSASMPAISASAKRAAGFHSKQERT
jgi:hypothetical protein